MLVNLGNSSPYSDANRSEYSKLNKLVEKSSKTDDNNWALRIADDQEEAARKGQQHDENYGRKSMSYLVKKEAVNSCDR